MGEFTLGLSRAARTRRVDQMTRVETLKRDCVEKAVSPYCDKTVVTAMSHCH